METELGLKGTSQSNNDLCSPALSLTSATFSDSQNLQIGYMSKAADAVSHFDLWYCSLLLTISDEAASLLILIKIEFEKGMIQYCDLCLPSLTCIFSIVPNRQHVVRIFIYKLLVQAKGGRKFEKKQFKMLVRIDNWFRSETFPLICARTFQLMAKGGVLPQMQDKRQVCNHFLSILLKTCYWLYM